jgi:hypothetical protein
MVMASLQVASEKAIPTALLPDAITAMRLPRAS